MSEKAKRVRKSPAVRREEIVRAAVKVIGEHGYHGTTLKAVADAVGMTYAGILHYVDSKEQLLAAVVDQVYDVEGSPEEFFLSGLPGSDPISPHFPAYLRYLVHANEQRRQLVHTFMVLQSEAIAPSHPLHERFTNRPEQVWQHYCEFPWAIPPDLISWQQGMRPIVEFCISMSDGLQLRWTRRPPISW